MKYRRTFLPGGSFFFTQVTHERRPLFADPAAVEVLRNAFREVREKRPFQIDAMVVLPDHLHCIWSLPDGDTDYSTRWRLIKTWFTKHSARSVRGPVDRARSAKGEQAVWQHRFWEHCLRDERDFERHVEYIHYNPVKHGHAARAADWPYSSIHRYLRAGMLPADWGVGPLELDGVGSE